MIISLFTVTDNVVTTVVFRLRKNNYKPKSNTMLNLRVGSKEFISSVISIGFK